MIPYARQNLDAEDIAEVVKVLHSDLLTQGPAIERFEQAVAEVCRAPHAVACSSGTAGLHLACLALGVGPGDVVWTSPNTFVASANAARYCGADIDFVDIDARTLNLDASALEAKLVRVQREGGRMPKVVIPVHFSGQSCPMADFAFLANRYGFRLLEDAAHAFGGTYQGHPVGSCMYSDLTVFSFHPVKIVTSGEGGAVVTRDPQIHRRIGRLRSHGITRDADLMSKPSPGAWYYEQVDFGYHYRMTDIQAALGASQIRKLDAFIRRRIHLVARYDSALRNSGLILPTLHPDVGSSWHLYVVQVPDPSRRRTIFDALRAAGIIVNVHYIPVHTQPDFQRLGFKVGDFPVAEAYYERALTLPLHPGLSDADQDFVIGTLLEALR